jgi:hypothetical protein
MRRLLLLPLLLLLCLLIPTSSPASSSGAARDCGNVTFQPDPYGSGGIVSAKNMDCKPARQRAKACGRNGVAPEGWEVSAPGGRLSGEFRMKRGDKVINVQIAGGGPPKLNKCLNHH